MNVIAMMLEVLIIANSVIRKSALPDFTLAAEDFSERMRVAAFHELNGMFDCDVVRRCHQKMHVFRHNDEGVDLESAFAAMAIHRLQEESDVVFDDEKAAALPCLEGHEIRSGRGDEASRLQQQTSAAKAAILCLA